MVKCFDKGEGVECRMRRDSRSQRKSRSLGVGNKGFSHLQRAGLHLQ